MNYKMDALLLLSRCLDAKVDFGRNAETKRFADLDKIEAVDVEDLFETECLICLKIRTEAIASRLVQVVILFHQLLKLYMTR